MFICNIVAFALFGILAPVLLPTTPLLWDHVLTVTLLHFVLTCLGACGRRRFPPTLTYNWPTPQVSLEFPRYGLWWAMLLCSSAGAVLLAFGVRRFVMNLPAAPPTAPTAPQA